MTQPQAAPSLAHLTDLSLDATGSFVLHATDEYFAPRENLLKPGPPEWREGEYTDRGKWMDGWESARRRAPGHDAVIVRLGTPGLVEAVLCDTTHFKGNAPEAVSIEILDAPATTPVEELLALPVVRSESERAAGPAWREIVPRREVLADARNLLTPDGPPARASHVRLRIHPDGGVARLRVLGHVLPDPDVFWGEGSIDLAAIEHGGVIAAASDAFFGPPGHLLLPGRGATMAEGWETRRRRTPGSDWCVIALGRRGVVGRFELDTHRFKGNAPLSVRIECLDAAGLPADARAARLAAPGGWTPVIEHAPLAPHHRHGFAAGGGRPVTHVRLHILPHGGVNRFRAWGHALDTPAERAALAALHVLDAEAYGSLLRSFCGARAFADALAAARPFASVRALFAAGAAAVAALDEPALLEALAAHPALGAAAPAGAATAQSAAWSRGEQARIAAAGGESLARLRLANERYRDRFGFVFVAFASGRTAEATLAWLEERLANDRATELGIAAAEQARITRLRMVRWLAAQTREGEGRTWE